MSRIRRALAIVVGTVGLALATTAGTHAGSLAAVSGTWTMTSDVGDSVGQGQSYAYTAPDDGIELGRTHFGEVRVLVPRPTGGVLWFARVSAPGGARLQPGTYDDAQRLADGVHPVLDISGDGRGCNETRGSFTVLDVAYGPHDYLQSLHLTFEHHCEGRDPALRGEIDLLGPQPPPPLEVELTVDPTAGFKQADGKIHLQGTVTCSDSVEAALNGTATQERAAGTAFAHLSFFTQTCSPTPAPWKIKVGSSTAVPFTSGAVRVDLTQRSVDQWYTQYHDNECCIYAIDSVATDVIAKPGG